jgi:hypothetical protein
MAMNFKNATYEEAIAAYDMGLCVQTPVADDSPVLDWGSVESPVIGRNWRRQPSWLTGGWKYRIEDRTVPRRASHAFCPLVPPLYEARVTDWIRRSLELQAGLTTIDMAELDEAVRCKRDPHFDEVRNARLRVGHLRYGKLGYSVDVGAVMTSIIKRAKAFAESPNREHLADIANLAEIMWCQGIGYWDALDGDMAYSLRVVQGDVPAPPNFWTEESP